MGRVSISESVREPCLVGMGTETEAEHGPGAGVSIGRHARVRPLTRLESSNLSFSNGAPAKADGFCGEEEMPSHWRNFLKSRKWSVVACALTRNKVVPRQNVNFAALEVIQGRFFLFERSFYYV